VGTPLGKPSMRPVGQPLASLTEASPKHTFSRAKLSTGAKALSKSTPRDTRARPQHDMSMFAQKRTRLQRGVADQGRAAQRFRAQRHKPRAKRAPKQPVRSTSQPHTPHHQPPPTPNPEPPNQSRAHHLRSAFSINALDQCHNERRFLHPRSHSPAPNVFHARNMTHNNTASKFQNRAQTQRRPCINANLRSFVQRRASTHSGTTNLTRR
jgi:hypothetical protein